MDLAARQALRHAAGQPACARALVAAARAGIAKGLTVAMTNLAEPSTVTAVYPLWDGSGWTVLFDDASALRVEDTHIITVTA